VTQYFSTLSLHTSYTPFPSSFVYFSLSVSLSLAVSLSVSVCLCAVSLALLNRNWNNFLLQLCHVCLPLSMCVCSTLWRVSVPDPPSGQMNAPSGEVYDGNGYCRLYFRLGVSSHISTPCVVVSVYFLRRCLPRGCLYFLPFI
jgi:hypothetical protein